MFGGVEVANFKALDSHVALIVNRKYALSASRGEMLCVQDRRFAGNTSESNVSVRRVAGHVDAYEFFVNSTLYVDGATRTRGICGMLNCAPRCRLSAGIRIIPGLRHVERGVGLAKRSASECTEHKTELRVSDSLYRSSLRRYFHRADFRSNSTGRCALCPDTVPRFFPVT